MWDLAWDLFLIIGSLVTMFYVGVRFGKAAAKVNHLTSDCPCWEQRDRSDR